MALSIISGNRPARPRSQTAVRWLPDNIWDAIQRCWAEIPQSRLPIYSLLQELSRPQPEKERKRSLPVSEGRRGKHNVPRSAGERF